MNQKSTDLVDRRSAANLSTFHNFSIYILSKHHRVSDQNHQPLSTLSTHRARLSRVLSLAVAFLKDITIVSTHHRSMRSFNTRIMKVFTILVNGARYSVSTNAITKYALLESQQNSSADSVPALLLSAASILLSVCPMPSR